jgi:hypothetical protein
MMKRNVLLTGAVAAVICLSVGCEWTGTSSEESWNDAYSWVNFSGTYRLYNTVPATPGTPGTPSETETEVPVSNESQGLTTVGGTVYNGQVAKRPVVAGSLTLNVGGYVFNDDGSGTLTGGASGTINYGTGAWSADTGSGTGGGLPIRATYSYLQAGTIITPGTPGTPGSAITSLTVHQQGNLLTFTDNNGVVYSGRVTGANVPSDSRTAGNVRLNFEVTAGTGAKIIGTLSGDWSGGVSGTLANRLLRGTYSRGGTHVELQGASGSISITPRPITSD